MHQKRIVVLGGVGFIGSHLCRRLLEEGNELFCIDIRDVSNAPILRDVRNSALFHFIHHNIVHPFGIRCDEIYNLAAPSMVRYNKALPAETLKVSMVGSIHALDTARSNHARVLYASSGNIYPQRSEAPSYDESLASTTCIVAESKLAAEALHRAYRSEFGLDTRIARIFNTFGSGGDLMDQRVVMKMVVAALQNREIVIEGSGEQLRTFCWIDDMVDGLIRLMQCDPLDHTRTVDLGGREEISVLNLANKIIHLTGSRSRISHIEERPCERVRRIPNLGSTYRELGWQPTTSLEDGLRRIICDIEQALGNRNTAYINWMELNC